MNIDNSLSFTLTSASNSFRTGMECSMNKIGLHGGQVFILISLWKKDGQNQINLAQDLNLTPPTINKMVKNLAANNFVSCQRCGSDGRMVRVYLTDKGRKYEELVKQQWRKFEEARFSNLTETEKLIFSQLLIKLKENFVKNSIPKSS